MSASLNPFAGMTGAEIYHNFHGGTGDNGAGLARAAFQVQKLIVNYNERAKAMIGLTTSMESAWEGNAGGAARRGAGPLAVEHTLAGDTMITAGDTMGNQCNAFNSAKQTVSKIPPTPDKPGMWDNLTSLGGAGRNYENQMNEVHAANDANVAVMTTYEGLSEENTSGMPTTYGRITDDHAAVGVERPPGLTPPIPAEPPPGTGTDPGSGNNNSNNNSSNTPGHNNTPGLNQNNNQNGNPTNPNQTTNPSDFRPPPTFDPPRNLPPGQNPGQNPNHPGMPGMMPPATFGPNGGGDGTGRPGGRGGFGPGGRGGGGGFGPGGSGSGAGGPGSGGPGSGARGLGSGFGPGGAAAAEGAAARGGLGGPGGGAGGGRGGGGMGGGGRRGEGEDDAEHERPSFLVEPDPHETFGTDEVTAPPVIGE